MDLSVQSPARRASGFAEKGGLMLRRFGTCTALLLVTLTLLPSLSASSHREAPAISQDPSVDATDLYAFRSPDLPGTVTLIANYNPLEEPSNGPNFYRFADGAEYDVNIDNVGDARAHITYRFQFWTDLRDPNSFGYNSGPITSLDSPNLNERQFYTVTRIENAKETSLGQFQVAPASIGPKSTPDYAALSNAAVFKLKNSGGRVFAGPRDDPFFVDIGGISDLLTLRPLQNLHKVAPVAGATRGVNNLKGYNVHTIALQIPISELTTDGKTPGTPGDRNAIIGVWTTASRGSVSTDGKGMRHLVNGKQVSRLGSPLVNEIIMSRKFKDVFNGSSPSGDADLFKTNADFRNRVLDPEVPKLMHMLYGVDVPPAPRNDLVQAFLTGIPGKTMPAGVVPAEVLRLNLGVPVTTPDRVNHLGAIAGDLGGFPNGRRLADDIVDIELRVAAGVLVPGYDKAPNNQLTDGVDTNDKEFLPTFPYLAMPRAAFDVQ